MRKVPTAKKVGLTDVRFTLRRFANGDDEYGWGIEDSRISKWAELDMAGISQDIIDLGRFRHRLTRFKGLHDRRVVKYQSMKKSLMRLEYDHVVAVWGTNGKDTTVISTLRALAEVLLVIIGLDS